MTFPVHGAAVESDAWPWVTELTLPLEHVQLRFAARSKSGAVGAVYADPGGSIAMQLDAVFSTAMFAAVLWSVGFLLPKAIKEHDRFRITCAVLTAALALFGWLLIAFQILST